MRLYLSPLFSGSSGNSIYVGTENDAVIVDAGMSASAILEEMNRAELDPSRVRGILVTHEHTDHSAGAGVLARKLDVPLYATRGTWEGMGKRPGKLKPEQKLEVEYGMDFYIGDLNIQPFPIPHDCLCPCGYAFSAGGLRAAIATDIGCVKSDWMDAVTGSDIVLLESNHDVDMLMAGPYSYELKRRIRGTKGHLSNEDAGHVAVKLARTGTSQVILGHLSKENNFPELALETVKGILAENDVRPGQDLCLEVARRDGLTGVFAVGD